MYHVDRTKVAKRLFMLTESLRKAALMEHVGHSQGSRWMNHPSRRTSIICRVPRTERNKLYGQVNLFVSLFHCVFLSEKLPEKLRDVNFWDLRCER